MQRFAASMETAEMTKDALDFTRGSKGERPFGTRDFFAGVFVLAKLLGKSGASNPGRMWGREGYEFADEVLRARDSVDAEK